MSANLSAQGEDRPLARGRRRPWWSIAGRLIMTAYGDAAMRDWLLVLVPLVFAVSWILYPEKFSAAAHWLSNLLR